MLSTIQYVVSLSFVDIHLFIMDMYLLIPLTRQTIPSPLILVSLASCFQSCSSSSYLWHYSVSVSLHCFSWHMCFFVVVWLTFPFISNEKNYHWVWVGFPHKCLCQLSLPLVIVHLGNSKKTHSTPLLEIRLWYSCSVLSVDSAMESCILGHSALMSLWDKVRWEC